MRRGILLANSHAQALSALEVYGLTEKDFLIVTDPEWLQGHGGSLDNPTNLRRIGKPFSPDKEAELERLVQGGRFSLSYGV